MTAARTESASYQRGGRGATVARVLVVAVLAGAWLVLARWVWQTEVPGDLRLPRLDQVDYFTPGTLRRAADYGRVAELLWVLSTLAGLAVLLGVALRARSLAGRLGIGRVGSGVVIGAVIATISAFVSLPLALVSNWWERRHGLSRVGYAEVVGGAWGGAIGEGLLLAFFIAVTMGFAAWLGRAWWVGAGAAFLAFVALLTFVGPYLIPDTRELRRPDLVRDARTLTRKTNTEGTSFRVQKVREETSQANAFVIGMGPTSRVVLWDTLLRFPHREVRLVMAHELAHIARGHLWKGTIWFALFVVPLLVLLGEVMRRRGGLTNPAAMPAALLVASLLALLVAPLQNVVSRRYEAEADWVALRATRDPGAARGLFARFARTSLSEPTPATWEYVMLASHPTIMQRIAMAKAWSSRAGERSR